jgi:hypothetical protein
MTLAWNVPQLHLLAQPHFNRARNTEALQLSCDMPFHVTAHAGRESEVQDEVLMGSWVSGLASLKPW